MKEEPVKPEIIQKIRYTMRFCGKCHARINIDTVRCRHCGTPVDWGTYKAEDGTPTVVYKYGMRLRGFSPGAQPDGGLIESEIDPLEEYWNVLVYSRKLSDDEMEQYDLDYIGKRTRR